MTSVVAGSYRLSEQAEIDCRALLALARLVDPASEELIR
jgi:hypothetical protein